MTILPDSLLPFFVRGTVQSAADLPTLSPNLNSLVEQLTEKGIEGQLLSAAGSAALQTKIGHRPRQIKLESVPQAPVEDKPYASKEAQLALSRLLQGTHPKACPQWLKHARKANQHVAPELLPELLVYGSKHAELQQDLIQVIGQRGRWLAHQLKGKSGA